jgi:hypothetical protein
LWTPPGRRFSLYTVTCTAARDDPAPGAADQTPGVLTGEIVTYWVSATIPQILLNPPQLSFGKVAVHSSATLNLRIVNVGPVDLIISVAPPPVHLPFNWDTVVGSTIAPGATLDFNPPGIGNGHGTLVVQSNAPGSPHQVALTGIGVKGSPQ